MTAERAALKRAFLEREGWRRAQLRPLSGDASNRRYERVASAGRRAVLMDAPAERGEDIGRFLAFTAYLRGLNLSAPEIYAADIPAGLALIEDLGDALFTRVAASHPEMETTLYSEAVELLPLLSAPPASVSYSRTEARVAAYDGVVLEREAMLALDWWAQAAGADVSPALRAEFAGLIAAACAPVAAMRGHLVLRDYHAENLIWLPERRGAARVGLLDYQDALAGASAYDLVSLLEDARRDTSAELRAAMIARYIRVSGAEETTFRAGYAALGAQRNLKIVGIFARLWLRDGKPQYLGLIDRVWAHLAHDLSHPALSPLAEFVARRIPMPDTATLARVRAARA
ncbi:phosphotransferase [Pikeienuella piscinae]|uniref:Phosphotransferase n=1 Tax=Pikeienuella piscinae TaxID=2748098 RepID=A0A7L5C138_9RHOB|nr:phosphotransferase [Pikeienuella piscinae]QIE57123.1 phosphotransferase [Pikeienuella piscinae]